MPQALRLAVDVHPLLVDHRGIGRYARALLRRILPRDDIDATLLLRGPLPGLRARALAAELGVARVRVAGRVPRGTQVLWSPWNGTFFEPNGAVNVVTMHDAWPFVSPATDPAKRLREQAPFRRSVESAQRILANSAWTRDELMQYLGADPARIVVIHLAAGDCFTPGTPQELPAGLRADGYILAVGVDEPRKNLATLRAAHRAAFPHRELELVIVTNADFPDARCLQWLSAERLRDLYRGARCFVMPSTHEGFGMPPLEAMGCGTPVLVSRAAALPETCAQAALYVDAPMDVDAWAAALRALAGDDPAALALRQALRTRGLQRAAAFTWEATADATLAELRAAGATTESSSSG
ncbi:MAG: glycosyltransferase family 4 protein [Vulcanimicrobiaceae bacterium]